MTWPGRGARRPSRGRRRGPRARLAGADAGARFAGARFAGARFAGARFAGARFAAARFAAAALLVLAACSSETAERPTAGTADEPREPRWRVVDRALAWGIAALEPDAAPLTLAWTFEQPTGDWTVTQGSARLESGALVVEARGAVALEGPRAPVDPDVHHWLVVRMVAPDAERLEIQWTAGDEPFDDDRRHAEPLGAPADDGSHLVQLRLDSLRGIEHGATAAQGLDRLRLRVRPAGPDVEHRVAFDEITLVSEYDRALADDGATRADEDRDARADAAAPVRSLGHRGVFQRGRAARTPCVADLTLGPVEAPARLLFACALAGRGATAEVRVTLDDGRGARTGPGAGDLPPVTTFTLGSDEGWRWTTIELAAGPPAATLRLEAIAASGTAPGVLLTGATLRLAREAEPRPDAILYVEDTLRADRLGTYGYVADTDPVLRRLAADAAVFERCFAASNWTRPSVSSLLTGLRPATHGNDDFGFRIHDDAVTLGEALGAHGYLTASLVTNFQAGAWSGLQRGFDVVYEPGAFPEAERGSTLTSTVIHDPLVALLGEHRELRTFVYVQSLDPHAPYVPHERDARALQPGPRPRLEHPDEDWRARFDADSLAYDAEVLNNDRELGRLLDALGQLELAEDTVLMFSSDHGEMLGEHGDWTHRKGLYQEEVHVPWLVRFPGRVPPARIDAPVSHVDVAPTLLGLLGLPPSPTWQGRDLAGLLTGDAPAPPPPTIYVDDTLGTAKRRIAVVQHPLKLIVRAPMKQGELEPLELFDLDADPGERRNLLGAPEHADDVARMLGLAERYVAEHRATRVVQERRAAENDAMDPAIRAQMRALGYLGDR